MITGKLASKMMDIWSMHVRLKFPGIELRKKTPGKMKMEKKSRIVRSREFRTMANLWEVTERRLGALGEILPSRRITPGARQGGRRLHAGDK